MQRKGCGHLKCLVSAVALCAAPVIAHAQSVTASAPPVQSQERTEPSAERKGFIIGIGSGAALHRAADVTVTRDRFGRLTVSSTTTNNLAIVTDFKVGYAPTDQLLIYYSNKAAFTRADDYDVVGVTGAGVTYMAKRTSPSLFITGGGGAAVGGTFIGSVSSDSGFGFSVGGGYEFKRHFSIAGDAVFVRLGSDNNHTTLMATFNYLFY
jgi:hypothetical protein